MKVFIPMSDALLSECGELSEELIPFTPELIIKVGAEKREPPNGWLGAEMRMPNNRTLNLSNTLA